jgi:hypothetical protein
VSHQLIKTKLKGIVTQDLQVIDIEKDTLIKIVIKVIGHRSTDKRMKRLFYMAYSAMAWVVGIFLQPERHIKGAPSGASSGTKWSDF